MIADFLLVQKIRNGDNQAGNQLVEKYYSSIYQYCYLHTHNQEYAEDMVQERKNRNCICGENGISRNAVNIRYIEMEYGYRGLPETGG